MSFSKEMFDSGKSNNIAILTFKYLFSTLLTIGTLLAILADTTSDDTWIKMWFSPELLDFYIKSMNLLFAGMILIIGEPTRYGWNKQTLIYKLQKSDYVINNKLDTSILENSINDLKTNFSKNWNYLWGAWTLLYLVLTIHAGVDIFFLSDWPETDATVAKETVKNIGAYSLSLVLITNFLNYLSSYFLFVLYLILVFKSESDINQSKENAISYHQYRKKFIFLCVSFLLTEIVVYLVVLSNFPVIQEYVPCLCDDNSKVTTLIANTTMFFQLCNGVIGGVLMALFIGRLIGSHTTDLRFKEIIILPVLYLYCAIQPLFVFVGGGENQIISFGVLVIALVCKFILYYNVVLLFDSRKILFHFIETMNIKESVKSRLPDFEEVWKTNNQNSL